MIEEVEIKGGLFTRAYLQFSPHLNVISGISGSGKSVLVDCILASVGLKPMPAHSIQMHWQTSEHSLIHAFKRKKTTYTHNHKPTSKKALKEFFSPLILHISSHKHVQELHGDFLIELLDSSTQKDLLNSFKHTYVCYQEAVHSLQELQAKQPHLDMLSELARFELAQLQSLDLSDGAYERLLECKKTYQMQEKRRVEIIEALKALEYTNKITKALPNTQSLALAQALEEAQDFLLNAQSSLEELENLDIQALLDKISQLGAVVKKHGSEAQARAHKEQLIANYEQYNNHQHHLKTLQEKVKHLEQECLHLALQIKAERQKHLSNMQELLESYTDKLWLKKPILELKSVPLGAHGLDQLQIRLGSANTEHISAGESNRLRLALLALKAKLHAQRANQILLVDELDANLSGRESASVAEILKELSVHYQVIAISHAPHLPSLAERHFLVFPSGSHTQVKQLSKDEQTLEIARMVDANLGQEAIAYAKMKLKPK
ncbi:DNA repair protein [Helicobacter suis]|uniref:DNA repair protein RecN n=1 Tax=Helicobacter suis TaxID=104628 RepID=A0A6J4CY26_9HELI|nr:DNA repair protein [Helicobacter suis]BCD70281.1 DNA repair protein RecN [Helicobacter suis]